MVKCLDCGKAFSTIYALNYHVNRHVCQKGHICPTCNRRFTSSGSLNYHITHNVCKIPNRKPKLVLKVSHTDLLGELRRIKEENAQLKCRVKTLMEITKTPSVISPSEFGKEDMKHVVDVLGEFLGDLVKYPERSISGLFDKIHNNVKLPEYHNVYTFSERSSYAMVSDGKNFKYMPKKLVVDQIIEDKRSILNHYIDENGAQLGRRVVKKYETYQDALDTNEQCRKDLEVEIGALLLNLKSVVSDNPKPRRVPENDINDQETDENAQLPPI